MNITVPRDKLLKLIELAEDSLCVGHSEFSSNPTEEDRELMMLFYKSVDKEAPPFFVRTFDWKI